VEIFKNGGKIDVRQPLTLVANHGTMIHPLQKKMPFVLEIGVHWFARLAPSGGGALFGSLHDRLYRVRCGASRFAPGFRTVWMVTNWMR
jgi:hypothetical protein